MSRASVAPFPTTANVLDDLRARIRTLESGQENSLAANDSRVHAVSLGASELDNALPWHGFPTHGLHEISGDTAATGFVLSLLARLSHAAAGAPVLWCQSGRDLYPPGLNAFGIDPNRLILAHGRTDTDILWALEEGVRSMALAAVVGRLVKVAPIAARRLQLAAEESGVPCLILRPKEAHAPAGTALTRWRVTSVPTAKEKETETPWKPHWQVELQRCRLSSQLAATANTTSIDSRSWKVTRNMDSCNETGDLTVVAGLRDRPAEPSAGQDIAG